MPIAGRVPVANAAFIVTMRHRSSSREVAVEVVGVELVGARSSRRRFIEPLGTQSVPSAMRTPMRRAA